MSEDKVYQMLWDCEYCGTRELLGYNHRHCPNCGARQDASKRYFPTDQNKTIVRNHKYGGIDLLCPQCCATNSFNTKCCTNCGVSLFDAQGVRINAERVVDPNSPGSSPKSSTTPGSANSSSQVDASLPRVSPPTSSASSASMGARKGVFGCGIVGVGIAVVALVLVCLAVLFFAYNSCAKRDAAFKVTGHTWTAEIPIEVYKLSKNSKPCSAMPPGAMDVSRQKQAPQCKTVQVDLGDGTFKESERCTDVEDLCSYSVGEWKEQRVAKKTGGLDDKLEWPQTSLSRTGLCDGCEREGERKATYRVNFARTDSKGDYSCDYRDAAQWRTFTVGSNWKGTVGGFGGINCSSLTAQ